VNKSCIYVDEKWPDKDNPDMILMSSFFTHQTESVEDIPDHKFDQAIGSLSKLDMLIDSVYGIAGYTYCNIPEYFRTGKVLSKNKNVLSRNSLLWSSMLSNSLMAMINALATQFDDLDLHVYHHQYDMNIHFEDAYKIVTFQKVPELMQQRNVKLNLKIQNITSIDLKDDSTELHALRGVRVCDKLCKRFSPERSQNNKTSILHADITKHIQGVLDRAENSNK
jgi:hypothetical protein